MAFKFTIIERKPGRKPGALCKFTCRYCGNKEMVRGGSNLFTCSDCKANNAHAIAKGIRDGGSGSAMGLVARAIREGSLVHPTKLHCVDCGKQASEYDHRDYNKPLLVEPVCRSCNLNRGPAIPLHGFIDHAIKHGHPPYRLKVRAKQLFQRLELPIECFEHLPPRLTVEHWHLIWPELTNKEAA